MSAAGWSVDFNELAAKVGARVDDVVRSVTLEVFSRVIMRSPVDTGRFRGNWFPSFGNPSAATRTDTDPTGSTSQERARAAVLSQPVGGVMYMTNSLPYAVTLEYGGFPDPPKRGSKKRGEPEVRIHVANGFSLQAPHGMVRIVAQEVNSILQAKLSAP